MSRDVRFAAVLVCFFLSGFAALLYETAWTRQFAFVFGTSELAVATVLAAYMAGLAAGAALAGRFVARVRRPVLVYGVLELSIALAALAVPFAIEASTGLYVSVFAERGTPPEAGGLPTALFYLVLSFAVLFVPTALMGATLPLLARHAVRREEEIGPRIAVLYAVNTAGAVTGVVTAGFVLLPEVGLSRTVLTGVGVNALIFVVAALLGRGAISAAAPATVPTPVAAAAGRARAVLPLMTLSGIASFTLEVLWVRLLTHLLGGSVYAFATMLASFLVGIAAGSVLAARFATTPARAARGFAIAQLGTATLSLIAFLGLGLLPELARGLGAGGRGSLVANALVAAIVLLPSALCIGTTFPFAVRILARREEESGPVSARVYAWNTLGAIVGSVAAGFVFLPELGYEGTIALAVALNLGIAASTTLVVAGSARRIAWVACVALLALAFVRPATPWRVLRSSALDASAAGGRISYFAVGRSATVLLTDDGLVWTLRTNGLPEAGIQRSASWGTAFRTARWLTALPVLARSEARRMLVVGLGGGVALEGLPRAVERADVVELEPEVLEANRRVSAGRARDPLADPRIELLVNDARGALVLTTDRYDAIVSQPSHPWTAGAAHLYTREFFELAASHLEPRGVLVQWMGLAFVDEPLLRTLLATLLDVFPHVRVYRPDPAGVLFLASREPFDLAESVPRALAADPEGFADLGLLLPEDLTAALVLDEAGAVALAGDAPRNLDDHNLLQSRSPRVRSRGLVGAAGNRVFARHDPLLPPPAEVDALLLTRRLLARRDGARAERVARSLPDLLERKTALALQSPPAAAKALLREVLQREPGSHEARLALLQLERAGPVAGDPEPVWNGDGPGDPNGAIVEGWRLEAEGDWPGLRALEPRLAAIPSAAPAWTEATRLRATWRLRSGGVAGARDALGIVTRLAGVDRRPHILLLRARVAVAAGEDRAALATLQQLVRTIGRTSEPDVVREATRLLAELPRDAEIEGVHRQVENRLRRLGEPQKR